MLLSLRHVLYRRFSSDFQDFSIAGAHHTVVAVNDECCQRRITTVVRLADHSAEGGADPVVEADLGTETCSVLDLLSQLLVSDHGVVRARDAHEDGVRLGCPSVANLVRCR